MPRIISALLISACFICLLPGRANAQSLSEYYSITYDIQFSTSDVTGTQAFSATVVAEATCIKDFPLSASQASITGKIIARNQDTGSTVTLNSGYTLTIDPFPGNAGESTNVQVTVPLRFPTGSTSGTYTVTAQLISATVTVLVPIEVTGYLDSSQTVGTIYFSASGGGGGGGGGGGSATTTGPTSTARWLW